MTTLKNRPNTALVVVDMQNGVVQEAHAREAVISNICSLISKARREQVSVIWVLHTDEQLVRESEEWQLVPELIPRDDEPCIDKSYGDSFENTPLEATMTDLSVGRIFVVGAQTDACVRSTLHGAVVMGYDVVLISDAHTTENLMEWGAPSPEKVIALTNLYWSHQTAPGRTTGTVTTEKADFSTLS
jgi:nicotinamidase-related amidase